MKKIKIGIISHNFPSSVNDRKNAGIFVWDLAIELSKNCSVVVFAAGEKTEIKKVGTVKTYFFEFREKLGNLKIYNPTHIAKFIKFFTTGKKFLEIFYKENQDIDFIISMWTFPGGYFANYLYRKYKLPYGVYCLGSDIYIYAKKPVLKNYIKNYLKDAALLLADSPNLAKEVERVVNSKTLFLPSASNFPESRNKLGTAPSTMTFTFLGRLEKVKGVDLLINSLDLLNDTKDKFQINIIGEGSLSNWVKQKTLDKKNIKLWGNLNNYKAIAGILSKSDYLIIPSRSDSIPLVFSESMKLLLPVIASNLPDLKYLIKKYEVGYLFEKENIKSLAKVLQAALNSKTDHKKFKKNTKKAAELFKLNKTAERLENLIRARL